jgi:4-phospho-D-threonate 3-dehydrogenase / 4-phospho-D-erythronate 3-dehydrogenase
MGDPAGIGPEIALEAAASAAVRAVARPLVVGDVGVLERARQARRGGATAALRLNAVAGAAAARFEAGVVDVLDLGNVAPEGFAWGALKAEYGRAGYEYLVEATALALRGAADAIVTAPIQKEAWHLAGVDAIGHTEALQALCGARDSVTMFVVGSLRTFFYTRHVPLAQAIERLRAGRPEGLARFLVTADGLLQGLGVAPRRIAVAALNPHAGENGLIGREEIEILAPGVAAARALGVDASGPIPADSVYHQALQGRWDAVISLYHDQGHIATKTLEFERTVSVTLALPILRTSVDHGTAFDIAGEGTASAVSMEEACLVAARYALVRQAR